MRSLIGSLVVTLGVASCLAAPATAADLSSVVSVRTDFDATTRTATVELTNTGRQAITGGAVRVSFRYSDGSETASVPRIDLLPSVGLEDKFTFRQPEMQIGALQPGKTYRILQIDPAPTRGLTVERASAEVTAVIFMDNTSVGDSKYIDEVFEQRREQLATLSAWYKKAAELLTPGAGEVALRKLSDEAKAAMALHPSTEPRDASKVPATEEEALSRSPGSLGDVARLIDDARAGIDAHRMSEAAGLAWFKEYLRIRTETLAAHCDKKGST